MLSVGLICVALCAVQVISLPLLSPSSEDDTKRPNVTTKKVMKCIVEVISDTLSKPNPHPISENCLQTLRGDERIISILRHQNLLKELQELAAKGATERVQKQKKNSGFEDELSEVLERQNNKPIHSGKSEGNPAVDHETSLTDKSEENSDSSRHPEEEEDRKTSSEHEAQENIPEDESAEELESNEISKHEEAHGDEVIDNHITDNINDQELPGEKQESEDTSDDHTSKEKEHVSKMSWKDAEAAEADERGDSEKESPKQDINETEDEEDDTQREDNSMKLPEDRASQGFDKEEHAPEVESSKEGGRSQGEIIKEGGNSHLREPKSDEESSSKELEDSKRWNKMDELAKQLTSKKWAKENSGEDDPDQSMKIPYDHGSQESEVRHTWQHSRDDSGEGGSQISKRPEPEERKEEEGSANRKTEDQELESLAAIEAELEKVAHKLHELRRG
ncbi:hypothetical protein FKM82_017119 [Ascaphus truei]